MTASSDVNAARARHRAPRAAFTRPPPATDPFADGVAGLAYGPLPQGEVRHSDSHRAVPFKACGHGEPSGSSIDGLPVTFWSGFVLARSPACVPLYAWIDDEPVPRRVALRMGVRRCA